MKKSIENDRTKLRRKGELIQTEDLKEIIKDLEDSLEGRHGYGLAGIQIGVQKQIAIIRMSTMNINLVNPRIIEKENKIVFEEGCLSFPGLYIKTDRFSNVTFENYEYDENSKSYSYKRYAVEGLEALVIQHEVDHLNGITIFDRKHKAK